MKSKKDSSKSKSKVVRTTIEVKKIQDSSRIGPYDSMKETLLNKVRYFLSLYILFM